MIIRPIIEDQGKKLKRGEGTTAKKPGKNPGDKGN